MYRPDKYIKGLDMVEVHDVIDSTLEKIRARIIDKAQEAENILKEAEEKIFEGRCKFESVKRQLNQLDESEVQQI